MHKMTCSLLVRNDIISTDIVNQQFYDGILILLASSIQCLEPKAQSKAKVTILSTGRDYNIKTEARSRRGLQP